VPVGRRTARHGTVGCQQTLTPRTDICTLIDPRQRGALSGSS